MSQENEQTVVALDFDHTCWATDEYIDERLPGYSEADKSDITTDSGGFRPEKYAEFDETVDDVYETIEDAEKFLYKDVFDALEGLDAEYIIVTRGPVEWQTEKVVNSGLVEEKEDVYTVQGAAEDVSKYEAENCNGEQADFDFLIDDTLEELENVNLSDEKTYYIERPDENLEEIVEDINQKLESNET